MLETVFTLDKNYRVKNKEFCDLLGRLRTGEPTEQDADIISDLHIGLHESDIAFTDYLKNNKKPCGYMHEMQKRNIRTKKC
jgi:hypothetical protein